MATFDSEQWPEVSRYLDEVWALPETQHDAWLDSFRAKNPAMGDLLRKLLEDHRVLSDEHFMEELPDHPVASLAGQTIGAYRLLQNIGQGGMGDVWLAERCDGHFEKQVAIKLLRFAVAAGGGANRFKREGKILAQLAHPNIAELLDAGVTSGGQPYLVLEHVQGRPITEYCDEHKLSVGDRIRIFLDVLGAVARAHANLVVHRDIKPSNVLVSDAGQVKLLDFGIAKLIAEKAEMPVATQLTVEGGGALTPQFAAPEQVTGGAITTATDIYSLGLLLYLLLTGRHPAGASSQSTAELVKAIVETEPIRASDVPASAASSGITELRGTTLEKLRRQLRGDLDTILGKMLKKDPAERYSTVTAVGEDLNRYLQQRPISARPDTFSYRVRKFVYRNRGATAFSTLAVLLVIAGATTTLVQFRSARRQRDFAFRELARADRTNSLDEFLLSDAAPSHRPVTANQLLERAEHVIERENYANDPGNHVKILASLGLRFFDRDENETAGRLLSQAYQLSRKITDPSARAQASCAFALSEDRAGKSDRAEALIQEGLREIPDDPQYALDRVFCLLHGSEVNVTDGAAQAAIQRAESAKRIAETSNLASSSLRLSASLDLASAYNLAGRYREATAEFSQAAVLMSDLGYDDTGTAAELYTDWGLALMLAGHPTEAEKVYRLGIDIVRSPTGEDAATPSLLNNYADALLQAERPKEAAQYAEEAYAKAVRVQDAFIIKTSLMERSRIYRIEHDLRRAAEMLDQVEPMLRRDLPPGHYAFARLASDRANIASDAGDLTKALQLVNEAVTIDERAIQSGGQGAHMLPVLLLQRSEIELAVHQDDKAETDAVRGLALAQSAVAPGSYSSLIGYAERVMGLAFQAAGKTDEARAAFRASVEHYENTFGPDSSRARAVRQLADALPRKSPR